MCLICLHRANTSYTFTFNTASRITTNAPYTRQMGMERRGQECVGGPRPALGVHCPMPYEPKGAPEAREACSAMKPEERPMSLTTPTPRYAELASTLAASSASCACSTAVSKPKHLSICGPGRRVTEACQRWSLNQTFTPTNAD